ncbi:hypothetical protein FN846DRAFT_73670 [Sphaerosporella brunnea]|uniref:Uncharacterized protein n=1 Tax=Sphaerosporella brunnea TaxID=1250544 RepID=A0A5J5ESU4_9PEZI|nr:hypothetical protein FN846DRAFT_73670 [Sphaerosporella brunnea]
MREKVALRCVSNCDGGPYPSRFALNTHYGDVLRGLLSSNKALRQETRRKHPDKDILIIARMQINHEWPIGRLSECDEARRRQFKEMLNCVGGIEAIEPDFFFFAIEPMIGCQWMTCVDISPLAMRMSVFTPKTGAVQGLLGFSWSAADRISMAAAAVLDFTLLCCPEFSKALAACWQGTQPWDRMVKGWKDAFACTPPQVDSCSALQFSDCVRGLGRRSSDPHKILSRLVDDEECQKKFGMAIVLHEECGCGCKDEDEDLERLEFCIMGTTYTIPEERRFAMPSLRSLAPAVLWTLALSANNILF